MKIQRFVGNSNHDVMRQVRLALGPDALIVSSRRTDAGLEILAADADALDEEGRLTGGEPVAVASPVVSAPAETLAAPTVDVMTAIDSLRGMLETRIDSMGWDSNLKRAPVSAALFQILLAAGFSTALLRSMLTRLPESLDRDAALAWARNELLTRLPVMAHEDDLLGAGGVIALVGPTGVGKTTTIAKLAARCVLRVGADRVAMLTTDSYRIGAYEQLKIYGQLMRVPVHSARDGAELRQALAALGERDLVLVDNVGVSQRDRRVAEQAAMLCAAGQPVRRLLVLNAASHGDTLDEVVRAYRGDDERALAGCILTKLDEAPRLGAALDAAMRYRLPVHYVSHGQKVPEDLSQENAPALIDRALAQADQAQTLYAPSDADLGAMWSAKQETDQTDQTQRRRQLLLSALAGGGSDINEGELDAAIHGLQQDLSIVLARTVSAQDLSADAAHARLTEAVRDAFASRCQSHLLAVHGTTALKGGGALAGSRLASALLMSDRGEVIAAPYQQCLTPQFTTASWSAQAAGVALDAASALRARVLTLASDDAQRPLVHVWEGGSPRLWQQLSATGVTWLSRVSAATRVIQDDGTSTAQALARTLLHAPVPSLAGDAATHGQVLWAAEAPVLSAVRQGVALRLVSVRLIDSVTGAVVARLYGLSNLAATEVSTARLAAWLAQQHAVKSAFRLMGHAWQAVALPEGFAGIRKHTLLAGQLGLASWQIATSPSAQAVRQLLQGMAGWRGTARKLPASAVPSALLRVFALLEMA